MTKKVKDLSVEEFKSLLENPVSTIVVGSIQVQSSQANLKEIEETVNRLVKKHKSILLYEKKAKARGLVSYV